MTDEAIGKLREIARSRTEASRVARAQMLVRYTEKPSFYAVGQRLGVHHQTVQRCVERALAYGPLAALDDRPRPGKRSRRKRRLGGCRWRATRPKSTAIRMSCGRRGFWHVTHASTARRRGTNVSPGWFKARCARSSARRKSSRTRCATIWNVAMPSSSRRWPRFCAFIARSRF
jgi:hypothetical protein